MVVGVVGSTVVVTRLQPRGFAGLRRVLRTTGQVVADCRAVPGFLGGRVAVDRRSRAWTLTVWDSPAALREFGARHASVSATIDDVARSSDITAFRQEGHDVPSWSQAKRHSSIGGPARPALHRSLRPAAAPAPAAV
jgi:hypothetical protein